MDISLIIGLGLMILMVILILNLVFRHHVCVLEGVAAELGCTVTKRKTFPPEVEVIYEGMPLLLFPAGVGARKNSSVKGMLSISRDLMNTPINEYRAKEIKLGSPEFDKEFLVKGSEDITARNLLDPDMQQRLLAMRDDLGTIIIKPDMILLMKPNTIPRKKTIELCTQIAKKVI